MPDLESTSSRSSEIAELAAALSQAQGQMCCAKKDSENIYYKSAYADLASCWDAVRTPLSANKLSVSQFPFSSDGRIGVETILMHASGQWISSRISVTPSKESDPQVVGSLVTYLRRYSLSAIVGIAQDEDDGNAASAKQPPKAETKRGSWGSQTPPKTSAKRWSEMNETEKVQNVTTKIDNIKATPDAKVAMEELSKLATDKRLNDLSEEARVVVLNYLVKAEQDLAPIPQQ